MLSPGRRIFEGTTTFSYIGRHEIADSTSGLLQLNARLDGGSGRRKFTVVDWDQDGDMDLLVNSDKVSWMRNDGLRDGKVLFTDVGMLGALKLAGHTTSPTIVDWNQDGIPDVLAGAEDGHFYYLENPF